MTDPALPWDTHCHTEFAHCATTVAADAAVAGARAGGLAGVVLAEHAFALYVPDADAAWSRRWQREPDILRAVWRGDRGRMDEYLAFVRARRDGERVLLGIELDLLADGTLSLAPEDWRRWDVKLGSIHSLTDCDRDLAPADARRRFMAATEALAAGGVDVLAHPFRWFVWGKRPVPAELYDDVARLCARHGVAAEINFHAGNVNDPAFFRCCRRHGVRLALGTDAHALEEIADLAPHLRFLEELGLPREAWAEELFCPLPRAEGGDS